MTDAGGFEIRRTGWDWRVDRSGVGSVGGWDLHRNLIPRRRKGRATFQTSMAGLRHPFFGAQQGCTVVWTWERGDGHEIDHLVIL